MNNLLYPHHGGRGTLAQGVRLALGLALLAGVAACNAVGTAAPETGDTVAADGAVDGAEQGAAQQAKKRPRQKMRLFRQSCPARRLQIGLTAQDKADIEQWLNLGGAALRNDRLIMPMGASAVDYYRQVQRLDPNNDRARRGIDRVVNRYLELARDAVEGGDWRRARRMVADAGRVGPHRAEPEMLARQIDLMSRVTGDSVEFRDNEVRNRNRRATNKIVSFGAVAKYNRAQVEIRAPSEEDGRWMYDQLNQAPGRGRVRVSITTGSPPRLAFPARED